MTRKEHLKNMLEALIQDDTEAANQHLHNYLSSKTRTWFVGEGHDEECDDDDDKEKKGKKDDDDDNGDDDDDDKEDKKFPFKKKGKKKDDDEVDESYSHPESYKKNEKGQAYHAVPHKDNSQGYGHEKSKAASDKNLDSIPGSKNSGADKSHPDAYKSTPHKSNSRDAKSEDKGDKGLDKVSGNAKSPYSDGKKVNRRTDKAK